MDKNNQAFLLDDSEIFAFSVMNVILCSSDSLFNSPDALKQKSYSKVNIIVICENLNLEEIFNLVVQTGSRSDPFSYADPDPTYLFFLMRIRIRTKHPDPAWSTTQDIRQVFTFYSDARQEIFEKQEHMCFRRNWSNACLPNYQKKCRYKHRVVYFQRKKERGRYEKKKERKSDVPERK